MRRALQPTSRYGEAETRLHLKRTSREFNSRYRHQFTLSAPDGKASVLHADMTRLDPGREYQRGGAGCSPEPTPGCNRVIHASLAQWRSAATTRRRPEDQYLEDAPFTVSIPRGAARPISVRRWGRTIRDYQQGDRHVRSLPVRSPASSAAAPLGPPLPRHRHDRAVRGAQPEMRVIFGSRVGKTHAGFLTPESRGQYPGDPPSAIVGPGERWSARPRT